MGGNRVAGHPFGCAAVEPIRVRPPHGSATIESMAFLDVFLGITNGGSGLAGILLNIAFELDLLIADYMAGDFLDLALCFFVTTLDLFFVHEWYPDMVLSHDQCGHGTSVE
jgi:hypothetical protein